MNHLFLNDHQLKSEFHVLAGIDEAGRGPLAGPVVVAAVILKEGFEHPLIRDSKKISESVRDALFSEIIENSICHQIEVIPPAIIDEMNILQATLMGMRVCAEKLAVQPDLCLIDGNRLPIRMPYPSRTVIKGDDAHACIAAASILAKVTRDRIMIELDAQYPGYGFAKHKGYPTREHLEAIEKLGVLDIHRKSYGPVAQLTFNFNKSIDFH